MVRCTHVLMRVVIPVEPVGGAPTCSIVAQEAITNGVMCELIRRRGFTEVDFKLNHPGGALGGNP